MKNNRFFYETPAEVPSRDFSRTPAESNKLNPRIEKSLSERIKNINNEFSQNRNNYPRI